MKVTRYVPNFVEDDRPRWPQDVSTMDQLRELDFVASWVAREDFHCLSVSGDCLILELEEGRAWHVIAWVDEPLAELPKWKKPEGVVP